EVPLAAPAVVRRVAVQGLLPEAAEGNPYQVVLARDRGEVEHAHDDVLRRVSLSHEGADAVLAVVRVDPLEPRGIGVELVQGSDLAVGAVQVLHPSLDPSVQWRLQEIPLDRAVVVPLVSLTDLVTH